MLQAVVGFKFIVVSTVCEQKVGEYLIADLLKRPFFLQWGLIKGQGPNLLSCSYVHTVCGAARLKCKTGCYIIATSS